MEGEDGHQKKKNPHDEEHFFHMEVAVSPRKISTLKNCFSKLKIRQFILEFSFPEHYPTPTTIPNTTIIPNPTTILNPFTHAIPPEQRTFK